jgi:hypothetical protein
MARTLQQLKESIERLIEQQGPDAPVAAYIFTNEDVFKMDEDGNPDPVPLEIAEKVLDNVDSYDYPYEIIFDCIEQELRSVAVS